MRLGALSKEIKDGKHSYDFEYSLPPVNHSMKPNEAIQPTAPSKNSQWLWCLFTPFPALIVGALIMRQHHVPSNRWGFNLIGGVVGAAVCAVFLATSRTAMSKTAAYISGCLAIGGLAATFAMAGSMGVHRWIPVGPLTIHAGAVCLPVLTRKSSPQATTIFIVIATTIRLIEAILLG